MSTNQQVVVVGVEGRRQSDAAVRYAVHEARRLGLPVHLVHAVHPMLTGPDPEEAEQRVVWREAQDMLDDLAEEIGEALAPDVPVSTQLVVGRAAHALLDTSKGQAALVLQPGRMGEHHRVPTYSVTSAVTSRSTSPVVAVPPNWDGSREESPVVTVGVDELGGSAHLLQSAFEEAQVRSATLRVLHAWTYSEAYDEWVFPGAEMARHSAAVAERFQEDLEPLIGKFNGVTVEIEARHGRPADELIAESGRSELLILGRHRTGRRVSHHLGSIVRAVLRESHCPVMVLDPIDASWVVDDVRD